MLLSVSSVRLRLSETDLAPLMLLSQALITVVARIRGLNSRATCTGKEATSSPQSTVDQPHRPTSQAAAPQATAANLAISMAQMLAMAAPCNHHLTKQETSTSSHPTTTDTVSHLTVRATPAMGQAMRTVAAPMEQLTLLAMEIASRLTDSPIHTANSLRQTTSSIQRT